MRAVLVHAEGGGERAAAYERDAGQLAEALYGAVLAVAAVQDREGGVQPRRADAGEAEFKDAVLVTVGGDDCGDTFCAVGAPGIGLYVVRGAVKAEPLAAFGYPELDDFILFSVDVPYHGGGRGEGDRVLGRAAAEDDRDIFLFHGVASCICGKLRSCS